MGGNKKKFYAVASGRKPGIYTDWSGQHGAQAQVSGFSGAVFKGFASLLEAESFLRRKRNAKPRKASPPRKTRAPAARPALGPGELQAQEGMITLYTDGGCINNPGPGGYGVVCLANGEKTERSGGFRLTTNNRMELMACIVGLQSLKTPERVRLYSDSKYVVDGITKGWAARWQANGWMRNKREAAENADLWAQLLTLCGRHRVEFVWVRGHAGNPGNERCDALATREALRDGLPPDEAYERGRTVPSFR
jgi:ribonuclease HI